MAFDEAVESCQHKPRRMMRYDLRSNNDATKLICSALVVLTCVWRNGVAWASAIYTRNRVQYLTDNRIINTPIINIHCRHALDGQGQTFHCNKEATHNSVLLTRTRFKVQRVSGPWIWCKSIAHCWADRTPVS